MKKVLALTTGLVLATSLFGTSYGAYDVVSCDSDGAFGANSCDQCFDGGTAVAGDNRGLLTDVWDNTSGMSQIAYKEEQTMPQAVSLNGATWTEVKASDGVDFWQYTPEFDNLYSESEGGYVLPADQSVTWIESTLGSAFELTSSSAGAGENVGLIVYDLAVHNMSDGNIDIETQNHRECVLIKSGTPGQPPVDPVSPELPQTGPEHWLLGFIALLLAFGIFYYRKKA